MLQIHRAVCIHQQAGTERLIVCRQGQLAAGDIGHHERERLFAGQVHFSAVIVPKFDAFRRDGPAHKVLGLILRGHFHLAADEHTTAAFGRLAAFDFAVHNFQFSRAVQHHGLARHGEGHGLLVGCIGVAAFVDGLAVQAVDVGAGGDGHGGACADVGGPIRRHTVDSHDLGIGVGIGVGIIPFDGVASYVGRVCLEVEHAAGHGAGSVVHTAREGSARDRSAGVVCHIALEGSVRDCSVGVVYHFFLKGAARNRSSVVYHFSLKGAVASDDAVAYHCSIEGAVRDCSAGAVQLSVVHLSVVHCCIEGTVGNCHTRLNLNRARHRRCGRCSWGLALGMGGAEIKRSTLQNQCAATVVLPAVALGAVQTVRQTVLHDEVGAGDRSVQHHVPARHGEFHGRPVVWFGVAAVARADGLAVQAIDFGAGGDDYGGAFVGVEVPWLFRVLRSILVPRAFAVHLEHTAIRYGDLVDFGGQPRLAVERAASHFAAVPRQARREGSTRDFSFGVYHCFIEDASGNFHIQSNHNRTLHRRCGRCSLGLALGMGGAEIKRSIIQSQCIGAAIVIPAVATGAVRTVRQTVLHDELWGGGLLQKPPGGTRRAPCSVPGSG